MKILYLIPNVLNVYHDMQQPNICIVYTNSTVFAFFQYLKEFYHYVGHYAPKSIERPQGSQSDDSPDVLRIFNTFPGCLAHFSESQVH